MLQRAFTLFITLIFTTSFSFAAIKAQTPKHESNTVSINPRSLKKLVLDRNIDLMIAMNQVHQAKARVNIARGSILPSINLGTVIASGVSFGLASVSVLLPFLLPSNWFDLRESQYLLNAQGTSYYIAQLNTYASAYSLYLTIVGDQDLRDALFKQYQNAAELEEMLRLAAELGIVNPEDFMKAQAQTQLTAIQVSQVDELLLREKAAVREMLGLSLDKEIVFERSHAPTSSAEGSTPMALLPQVLKISPEYSQMNDMITAAKYMTWSKSFSWLTGASIGSTRSEGSFGSGIGNGTANLGFGYFPSIQLSNLQGDVLRLQKQALEYDHAQILESTLGSLAESIKQYNSAVIAETNLQKVYDAQVARFRLGMATIVEVLQTSTSLSQAVTNKVQAQSNMDAQRVTLHRTLLSDQFSTVEKCRINRKGSGGFKGKVGRVLNPTKDQMSLDDACGR